MAKRTATLPPQSVLMAGDGFCLIRINGGPQWVLSDDHLFGSSGWDGIGEWDILPTAAGNLYNPAEYDGYEIFFAIDYLSAENFIRSKLDNETPFVVEYSPSWDGENANWLLATGSDQPGDPDPPTTPTFIIPNSFNPMGNYQ